jgi:hypothetical protein
MTQHKPTRINLRRIHWQTIRTCIQRCLAVALMMALPGNSLFAEGMFAQGIQTAPSQTQPQISSSANATFTLPAGTKLPLGLLRPLSVKSAKPGTDVYLQITFPVSAGSEMVIPPGTYVQGVISKIIRRDRSNATLEFELRSAKLIFSNGYTVAITGTVSVSPTTADLSLPEPNLPEHTPGQPVPVMAAVGGPPALPPLPAPSLGNGPRDAIIGLGVAGAIGTVALILFAHHSDVQMETGTPMEIVLPSPLPLDPDRVMAAVQQYNQQATNAPPEIVQPPKRPTICYDPGSPGTPDMVIPGAPGTAPTVIPGTPGTPGREYECGR